ncbi:MAG: TetR/AcrR family transcriptional regulator [Rhizobiaceae bacterium]
MVKKLQRKLSREDWVRGALDLLEENGISGVKITVIAKRLGATSGSFYWHFGNLRDLHDSILDYWERTLTDDIIALAKSQIIAPEERIHDLMERVIENDAALHDHALSVWARSDPVVRGIFNRTIQKRFENASWMFEQAGFSKAQASVRGRLMVAYLMGESSHNLKLNPSWRTIIRKEYEVLIGWTM